MRLSLFLTGGVALLFCACALVAQDMEVAPESEGGAEPAVEQPEPEGGAETAVEQPEPEEIQLVGAPLTGAPSEKMIALNFAEAIDLRAFLEIVAKKTGRHFLYDDTVLTGKVTLLTPTQIPEESLFGLLESLLEYKGFALVPGPGGLIKVVRADQAGRKNMPLLFPDELDKMADSDAALTVVYQLRFISVPEVQATIAGLVGQGAMIAIPRANVLFITDYMSNLKRIVRLIRLIDDEKTLPKLKIFALEHARAEIIARQVATIVRAEAAAGGAPAQQQPTVEFDAMSNAVIVVASDSAMAKIEKLILSLDVEPPASSSTRQIFRLKNAKADEIAATLQQLTQQTPMGVRAIPGGGPQPGAPGYSASGVGAGGLVSIGEIRIIGDKGSNSIIVFGPADQLKEIGALIEELDRRKPQVHIEALLVQVTSGETLDVGAELSYLDTSDKRGGIGVTAFGFSTYDYETGERVILGGAAPVAEGITGVLVNDDQIPLLMRALLTDRNGKIISRPKILANDNQEAKFESLDEQPYTTLSTVNNQTSTSLGGYAKAGTSLTITPHISEGDYLSLEIALEISQFSGTSDSASVPPPKRSDTLKTSVTVPDSSTIVIGGLSGYHKTQTVKKVPILGDIPVLGVLFRRKVDIMDDSTEYIFIDAKIARDEQFEDLKAVSAEAKAQSEEIEKQIMGEKPGKEGASKAPPAPAGGK